MVSARFHSPDSTGFSCFKIKETRNKFILSEMLPWRQFLQEMRSHGGSQLSRAQSGGGPRWRGVREKRSDQLWHEEMARSLPARRSGRRVQDVRRAPAAWHYAEVAHNLLTLHLKFAPSSEASLLRPFWKQR